MSTADVGLYSIGVRGLSVPDLLAWAAHQGIPFVHLRGGTRGYDLARQKIATLDCWRRCAQRFVPITGVTADLDLADLFDLTAPARARARAELERLATTAAALGAGWVRLLGRTVPQGRLLQAMRSGALPAVAVPLLVELHHPDWLAPAMLATLEELLGRWPQLRLLADTAQLAAAVPSAGGDTNMALERVLRRARVLHLSNDGTGLDTAGHRMIAARAAHRIAGGQDIEVAVEWTGQPRTTQVCLGQFRAACHWWAESTAAPPRRP
ncbi:AP endonuclease [Streptomyces sp. MS1.AVA.3]|uniref:AP endonuclease n=1 Tax=Streptomyces decoyicus TaxID=249567 RepID=UPI0030BB68C2